MALYRRLRTGAAPVAKNLLLKSGALAVLRETVPSAQLAILRYHAICGPEGWTYASPGICVSPGAFDRHAAYLSRHYRVLSLPEAVAILRQGRQLPPNAVSITFDDGYADNLQAARVLHRYGLTGTFYITAGCLEGEQPFWPAELRALLRSISQPNIHLTLAGSTVQIPFTTNDDRAVALARLTKMFKAHPIAVREDLRHQLRRLAGFPVVPDVMLNWSQVAEMRRLGMTIGAHTVTHPNLPSAGLDDATAEIYGSKRRLEQELGGAVTMFSYPNGGAERYHTPELIEVVRNAGFEAATTSKNGFAGPGSPIYALERIQVSERLADLIFALEVERFAFAPVEKHAGS